MIDSSPSSAVEASASGPLFAERLSCPASYWFIGLGIGLSFVSAAGLSLGPWGAVVCTSVAAAGIVAILLRIGHVRVLVDADGLLVAGSRLEWKYLGEVGVLDRAQARRRLGAEADARAFVVERPYVGGAVEVAVADDADPHPYWLVSTRNPARLAEALARGQERHGRAE